MQTRQAFCSMMAAAMVVAGWQPARATPEADLAPLIAEALAAMDSRKWEQAWQLLTRATSRDPKEARRLYGAKFGIIHYHKGICELRLRKYPDAMKSFESCYRDFPNQGGGEAGGNIYQNRALLKWGEAAQGAGDFQQAIRLYQKFLGERDRSHDRFPQGAFYVNLAICHFKLAGLPEGIENLEIAIRNKADFPTPDTGIVAGFQALVAAVIAQRNEQALLDFIGKNRPDILIEPFEMPPYGKLFVKLAGDAAAAGMDRAAIALYQMIPASEVAREDLQMRLDMLGPSPSVCDSGRDIVASELKGYVADIDRSRRGGAATDAAVLSAMALLHEKHGSPRAAFAAFEQLELYWSDDNPRREDNLFHLVRCASRIGDASAAELHGRSFLRLFPASQRVPDVCQMVLGSLFRQREYRKCVEMALPLVDKLKPGSGEHDLCLRVLGGSYYHLGDYDKAQPWLDRHVALYPKNRPAEDGKAGNGADDSP